MTTLPLINSLPNKSRTRSQLSYLRFQTNSQLSPGRYSLQQQTYDVVNHKKFLYIDFQAENKIFELEKAVEATKQQDETEQIGTSRIGGFQMLSKISPSAYKMHKFLSEQQIYFERKARWRKLLKSKQDETNQINFSKIRQNLNPQKLEDYLENKHNQDKWRKIQDRQQKLYQQLSNQKTDVQILTINQNRVNANKRLKARHEFKAKIKLKALGKLNSLLQKC